jgi:hypothetical protein
MTLIPVWTFLYVKKLQTAPACICSDVSGALPDDSQCSTKFHIFFPKSNMGKCCNRPDDVDSRSEALLLKASSQFKLNRPDASLPWSGCAYDRYENYVQQITHPDGRPPGPDAQSLYKGITCSGHAIVRATVPHRPDTALKQERSSAKFLEFQSHICPSGWPMTTVRTAPSFIKLDAHLSPQPINRGPVLENCKNSVLNSTSA